MEDHNADNHAKESPRKRRRQRPNGRWSNPASPLQAARFAHRLSGKAVVVGIRALCEGHSNRECHIDVSKLSDYETGNRRPGIEHITALCKLYQMSPEALGLIHWRDTPESGTGAEGALGTGVVPLLRGGLGEASDEAAEEQQLVVDWLLRSAAEMATVVMKALADYPLRPAPAGAPARDSDARGSEPPEEDPPPEAAGVG